jgi:hypothetical protein
MKKALLACSIIVGSVFFAYAQLQVGDVKVNVGKICGTISGKPACVNPSTGQWEVVTGNGTGIGGNVNTGTIGGVGVIGGVKIGGTLGGGTAGTGGVSACDGIASEVQRNACYTAQAQGGGNANYSGVLGLLSLAQTFVARSVPLLVGIALLAFFWFLVEFIWKGKDNPDEQKKGKSGMFYAILAIFVMVSIWGIIAFVGQLLGINQGGTMGGFKLPGEK